MNNTAKLALGILDRATRCAVGTGSSPCCHGEAPNGQGCPLHTGTGEGARRSILYRLLASAHNNAAPAAMPAIVRPVRFMDFSMAAWRGRTQASSG